MFKDQTIIVKKFKYFFAVDCSASYLSNDVISGSFELSDLHHFPFMSSSSHPNSGRSYTVFLMNLSYSKNSKILDLN